MDPRQVDELQARGFVSCERAISEGWLETLRELLPEARSGHAGSRAALGHERVRAFVRSEEFRTLVEPVLGGHCFAVRAILFDKSSLSNWSVPPHQDLAVAVRHRIDVAGFGPWTRKEGIHHALAPSSVLEHMLAVRIHMDPAGPEEGALRLVPATHSRRLSEREIGDISVVHEVTCSAKPGDALVMRPLVVHSSSKMRAHGRRRVLQVELAASDLPGGLEWHERAPVHM